MKSVVLFICIFFSYIVQAQYEPGLYMGNNWAMEDMSNPNGPPSYGTNLKGVYFWRPQNEWYFTTTMTRVSDAQAANGIGYVSFVSTHIAACYHPVGIGFGSDANGNPFSIDMSAPGNDTIYIEIENVSNVDINIRVGLKDANNNLIDTKATTPLTNIPSGIIDITIPKNSVKSQKFVYQGGFYAEWKDKTKCNLGATTLPCGIQKVDFTKIVGANITINSSDPQNVGLTNTEVRIRKMQFGNDPNSLNPTSISLNKTSTSINSNSTEQLTATILPTNAANKNVLWTSSNTAVAGVDATGLITPKSIGTTTITATTELGSLQATCAVIVSSNYSINSTAGENGSISPTGVVEVAPNADQTFTITPNSNYELADIKIDGVSVALTSSFTIKNIISNHTIDVKFKSIFNNNPIAAFTTTSSSSTSTAVQVNVKSILNARPVITYSNGKIVPMSGGIDAGSYSAEATLEAATQLKNANPIAMPNDGKYAANARHPEVVLNFSNADGTSPQVRRTTVNETFSFAVPEVHYSKMQIFAMSSGMSPITVTLNYSDASTDVRNLQVIDWYNYPGAPAETADRFNLDLNLDKWDQNNNRSEQYNHYLYGFDLSPNVNKTLKSIKIAVISGGCFTFWGATGLSSDMSPSTVTFDGSTSSDIDFDTLSYTWDFGDGSTGTGKITTHKYSKGGIYTATLTVSDGNGGTSVLTKSVVVYPLEQFPITANSGAGGTITPSGAVSVTQAQNQTFTFNPAKNYSIANVLVDGISVGTPSSYTFTNVNGSHTISVSYLAGINANIAIGKPVSASSTEAGFGNVATNINDENAATRWSSVYTDPQWVYIDLLENYKLSSVILHWEAANAKVYSLEYSLDAKTWTNIITKTAMPAGARIDTIANLTQIARYVRMTGTARNTLYGYSLFEIEIYGTKVPLTQTIQLQKGWNLISFNVSPSDKTIETVFKDVLANVAEVKTAEAFWIQGQNKALNSLKTISDGSAYLVKMNDVGILNMTGIENTEGLGIIKQGWQMMGFPFQTSKSITTTIDATKVLAIKNFDGFWNGTNTGTLQVFDPGKGYFLKGK